MADQDDPRGRRLWSEEVAQMLGLLTRTVIFSASKTRRKPVRDRTAVDMPLPGGKQRRQITTASGAQRTIRSPWWWESDVRACLEARRAAGLLDRSRTGTGQFKAAG